MKTRNVIVAAAAVLTVAGLSFAAGKAAANKEVMIPAAEQKWFPMIPNMPEGPQLSVLWGDPSKAANGFLLRLPAGFNSGWHTHSNDYRAVVLKGTMGNSSAEDTKEHQLGIGSYYSTPGKLAHNNHCLPGSECLVYIHYDQKQDYQPAADPTAASKK